MAESSVLKAEFLFPVRITQIPFHREVLAEVMKM